MPFRPDPFLKKFERLRTLRQKPALGYAVAIASIALASAARAAFSDQLVGVRFAPYYIAVALTAAVGGGGPGLAAIGLSVVAANYLMPMSPAPATPTGAVATSLFVIISGVIVTLIWLLNHAIDRIWHQAESTRLIVEAQPAGVIGVDDEGRITLVNSAVERQLGYSRDELLEQSVDRLVPVDVRDRHSELRESYLERPEAKMMGAGRDLSAVAKDGSLLPVEIGLNPVVHGGMKGALAIIVDISERKNLERRMQILADEVSHRARNLLTVVQALALRKLPRESSAEFVRTLETLAATQRIFGNKTVAPLRSIVEAELDGFMDQANISGCNILLTPAAGQDFSLIVHELATNALKHGSLSTPAGAVDIEGHESKAGQLRFVWTERHGPPIKAKPGRTGFGQKILQEIARGLGAQTKIDYLPQGLRYELLAPIGRITNLSSLTGTSGEA